MLWILASALSLAAGVSYGAETSALLRGQVHAIESSFGFDYGHFSAEVELEGLDEAISAGFEEKVEDLFPRDSGDDNCRRVLRSRLPATLKVRIYGKKSRLFPVEKLMDRTYAVDLIAARGGRKPCEPVSPQTVAAVIRDVVAVHDLASGEEYLPGSKILSQESGPHGQRFGWDTFTVLGLKPAVTVAVDQDLNMVGEPEMALDLTLSEYGKTNGKAVMSEAGAYFHGVSARMTLH